MNKAGVLQAAINVGAVSVLAGGGGTLAGGIIVKKLSLKVRMTISTYENSKL